MSGVQASGAQPSASTRRLTIWVSGQVQGVGFRWWTRARALELGLSGWARNRPDGRVEVVAEGSDPALQALLALVRPDAALAPTPSPAPVPLRPGSVTAAVPTWTVAKGVPAGFIER